jgi:hypothetical protein
MSPSRLLILACLIVATVPGVASAQVTDDRVVTTDLYWVGSSALLGTGALLTGVTAATLIAGDQCADERGGSCVEVRRLTTTGQLTATGGLVVGLGMAATAVYLLFLAPTVSPEELLAERQASLFQLVPDLTIDADGVRGSVRITF